MPRLYACIIAKDAKRDRNALVSIADKFSYALEEIEDGILLDVSGLERLIGDRERVSRRIAAAISRAGVDGSIAVAETPDAAILLARRSDAGGLVDTNENFAALPLADLELDADTLNVFGDLGIRRIGDLLSVPRDELTRRYGREFDRVIKRIEKRAGRALTPNIKEKNLLWSFDLDHAVEDFEQLIFILNHGLEQLLGGVAHHGKSCDHLDVEFRLSDKETRNYEIKTSFPTIDRGFWLKLINLRVSMHPPEAAIRSVRVTAHFTKPRPEQRGLYAVSRPEPESLLLTSDKIKKLVGEENVGTPVLLDQRLARPFKLDAERLPSGKEAVERPLKRPLVAFTYFRPAISARAVVRDRKLISISSREIEGRVIQYSGVWRASSKWWESSNWRTQEWDVEIENGGVYRIAKAGTEWFLIGQYD